MAGGWRPRASLATLRERAALSDRIRDYFRRTGALEVDTPVLMRYGNPDPAITSLQVDVAGAGRRAFLQTSPEFAMKRLLAAGSGDIYQFAPAFRGDEAGHMHLTEFTLLEWYRVGVDHHALIDDVEALVRAAVPRLTFARAHYAEVFEAALGLNPHTAATDALAAVVRERGIELGADAADRVLVLDALYAELCHGLARDDTALFVVDFPVEHAAYARIAPGPPPVANRFELVVGGMELANGYYEVTDPGEQRQRFERENARRVTLGRTPIPPDPDLLAALSHGLPACAGVALGFDRLVMLATGTRDIAAVVAFAPFAETP